MAHINWKRKKPTRNNENLISHARYKTHRRQAAHRLGHTIYTGQRQFWLPQNQKNNQIATKTLAIPYILSAPISTNLFDLRAKLICTSSSFVTRLHQCRFLYWCVHHNWYRSLPLINPTCFHHSISLNHCIKWILMDSLDSFMPVLPASCRNRR